MEKIRWQRDRYGLRSCASSRFAAKVCVYAQLRDSHGYQSLEACYADRVHHRATWFELIRAYTAEDPARLAREILQEHDVYVGMRSSVELLASRAMFTHVVWVDASQRHPAEDRASCQLTAADADSVLDNNGDILALSKAVDTWVQQHAPELLLPKASA